MGDRLGAQRENHKERSEPMALYRHSGVSVESWVELTSNVPVSYELDRESGHTTLVFGGGYEYVLCLQPAGLRRVAHLVTSAVAELDAQEPGKTPCEGQPATAAQSIAT